MAGTAGSYGWPGISKLAGAIEAALITGEGQDELDRLGERLVARCRRAVASLDPS